MSLDLVKVLSTDTDRKIGEAASAVQQFFVALTVLTQNINLVVVKLKGEK